MLQTDSAARAFQRIPEHAGAETANESHNSLANASGEISAQSSQTALRRFKRAFNISNESFSFEKSGRKREKEQQKPHKSPQDKLQNSLASLVFSRQESQVFELSRSDLDSFQEPDSERKTVEKPPLAQRDLSVARDSESVLPVEGNSRLFLSEKQAMERSSHLFVGDREVVIEDVLEDDRASTPPKIFSEEEMAVALLRDQCKQLQVKNKLYYTQVLDAKEQNATLSRRLCEAESDCALVRSQLSQLQSESADFGVLENIRNDNERLMEDLRASQATQTEQGRQLIRLTAELEKSRRDEYELRERYEDAETTSEKLKAKLRETQARFEFQLDETSDLKLRYQMLSRRLVRSEKMTQDELREIGVQSKAVETEFQLEYYYRQRCDELERDLASVNADLERQRAEYALLKAESIKQIEDLRPHFVKNAEFAAQQRAFLLAMHEQLRSLQDYAGWTKVEESCFCFPSTQTLVKLFMALSQHQRYHLWKLIDCDNIHDCTQDLCAINTEWAALRSEQTFLAAWDQDFEAALKTAVKTRYAAYYALASPDLIKRNAALSEKWFLTDHNEHLLTLWAMWLLCFEALGGDAQRGVARVDLCVCGQTLCIETPADIMK